MNKKDKDSPQQSDLRKDTFIILTDGTHIPADGIKICVGNDVKDLILVVASGGVGREIICMAEDFIDDYKRQSYKLNRWLDSLRENKQ